MLKILKKVWNGRERMIVWVLILIVLAIFWYFAYNFVKYLHQQEFEKVQTELKDLKKEIKALDTIKVTDDGTVYAILEEVK